MTQANKKTPRKRKKKGSTRKKSAWSLQKTSAGQKVWSRGVPGNNDIEMVVGLMPDGQWVVGTYSDRTDELKLYADMVFSTAKAAKAEVDAVMHATIDDVRGMQARVANRDVGDVVLVAEQYYAAKQSELDMMKRGTPAELAKARKKTKLAKEALEDMTGANREMYGAIGGGTLGAFLGGLTGNLFATAIGSLAGSVIGSVVAAPSPPTEAPEEPTRKPRLDDDAFPFPRRTPRVKSGRGYVANPDMRRRLTRL